MTIPGLDPSTVHMRRHMYWQTQKLRLGDVEKPDPQLVDTHALGSLFPPGPTDLGLPPQHLSRQTAP